MASLASARIPRWVLTLGAYHYTIRYKAGSKIGNCDALSRLPTARLFLHVICTGITSYLLPYTSTQSPQVSYCLPTAQTTSEDCLPGNLVHLVCHLSTTAMNPSDIKTWTDKDPVLSQVRKYLHHGWSNKKPSNDLKPYKSRKNELNLMEGCVLWGVRVIVPPQGRRLVLQELHDTCLGVSALARIFVWWPGMDSEIEDVVKSCSSCQVTRIISSSSTPPVGVAESTVEPTPH